MTRDEIRQIIDRGWEARRKKQVELARRNSERARKWKEREQEHKNLKRWKHYLENKNNEI